MKAQVIVTPLPNGSKLKTTVQKNYDQLLEANNNNVIETKWWNHFLNPVEKKYHLLYHSGKSALQIYYPQGRNMNVNKEINNHVSQVVKKANDSWQQVLDAIQSFKVYQDSQLVEENKKYGKDYQEIYAVIQKSNVESDEYKQAVKKFDDLREKFQNEPKVKELTKQRQDYEKFVENEIDTYLNQEIDLPIFLEAIKFNPKLNKEVK